MPLAKVGSDPFHAEISNPEVFPTLGEPFSENDRKVIVRSIRQSRTVWVPRTVCTGDVPEDLKPNGSWIVGADRLQASLFVK